MDGFDSFGGFDYGTESWGATPAQLWAFELPPDVPEVPYDDPMAYALPACVDALAFDTTAANAGVGFAMNEVARANELALALAHEQAQAQLHTAAQLCESWSRPVVVREDGWPDVADLVGCTRADAIAYYRAKFAFELAHYGRIISR